MRRRDLCCVAAICTHARVCMRWASRSTIGRFEERKDETVADKARDCLGSRRPCLPPRRSERLHRERTTKSKRIILYMSHKERGREIEWEKERDGGYICDQRLAVRKRETEKRRQGGDMTEPRSWRWEFMEMNAAHATRRCFPTQSLYEETTLHENRGASSTLSLCLFLRVSFSLTPSFSRQPWNSYFENFQENGMKMFVKH